MPPGEFREIGHRLVDQIADRLAKLPDGPVTPDESPADVRAGARRGADASACRHRRRPAAERGDRAAVRPLAVQRASALLRLHHLEPRADRDVRRFPGGRAQSERGRVAAGAARDRDRRAGRAVDCRADRVSHRLRRAAGQRRQHGELRLLRRRSRGQGPVGRAKGGAVARRTAAAGLRVDGNPHVDPEGRRSVRARHRRDPLDCHRRRAADGRRPRCAARSSRISGSAISRFSSSAPRAR